MDATATQPAGRVDPRNGRPVFAPSRAYGPGFDGTFKDVKADPEGLAAFRAGYFAWRPGCPKADPKEFVGEYAAKFPEAGFYPNYQTFKGMTKKWDVEILGEPDPKIAAVAELHKRDKAMIAEVVVARSNEDLERATRGLAGLLLDDAVSIVRSESHDPENPIGGDLFVKRRMYALNVVNYVSRHVKGRDEIAIKRQSEKRETVGFMMNIMQKAMAGKISPEQVDAMRSVNAAPKDEE